MSPASILDLIAVFIFALTGGLVASRAQLDVVGFLFLGCLTGVGGGTLRDLVLGRDPVFWIGSPHYLGMACAAAILAFFTSTLWRFRWRPPPAFRSRGRPARPGRSSSSWALRPVPSAA